MKGKTLAVRLVIAVLAVCGAAPSTGLAANDPDLTQPTGTMLAVGTKITGTNIGTGLKITTNSGVPMWECPSTRLTGTLTKNNGSEVEADVESFTYAGTGVEEKCTLSGVPETDLIMNPPKNGLPWCLRSTPSMKDDEAQIRGGSCAEAQRPIRSVWLTTFKTYNETGDLIETHIIECVYERSGAMIGAYTTHSEDAIVTFSEVELSKTAGGFICPTAFRIDVTLTLERDEASAKPLYIS